MKFNASKYNQHWQDKELDGLGVFQRGKSRHRPRNDKALFENGTHPLVQTGEIKEANLYIHKHSDAYNDFGLSQSKLWPKDTLCITIAANIAETALLGYPMCFPDSVVGFNAYKTESSELFMHYVFTYIRRAIQNSASGSIQDNINIDYLTKLKFKIPDKSYQDKIAAVLSTLDTKIELNKRINTELEAMAKTLYDYWFVQFDFPYDFELGIFDPNGKPYKSSGGKMVYNETLKREIPEGWGLKEVCELIEVRDGTHDSPKKAEFGQYLITSKHIKKSGIEFQDAYLISDEDFEFVNKRSHVHEGDFLLSMIGTVGLTHWVKKITTPFAIKNIGLFKTSQSLELADYIYSAVNSSFGKGYLEQNISKGTSQPYVTLGTLRKMPIVIPVDNVLNRFVESVAPLHNKMYLTITENQQLTQLRDWLLPMLMNGQVTVK